MAVSPSNPSSSQAKGSLNRNESGSSDFKPYVPASQDPSEFSIKSVLLGILFAIIFGTSSVYLALCAGLTVGASIPIAVMVIGLFRKMRKNTILENNLVQTLGSAGESVSSVLIFSSVAFIFIAGGDKYFQYKQLMTIGMLGGLVGIFFMIPLRRSLIVKEHATLKYPEGTACAEVLIAGEKQGDLAKPVFLGSLVAMGYWIFMKLLGLWKEIPTLLRRTAHDFYPNATLTMNVTPEYLGIGYIIGPRVTLQMLGGGLFAWMVLIPLFSAFPQIATFLKARDVFTTLKELGISAGAIQDLPTAGQVHAAHVKYLSVGTIVGAGLITLIKTFPVIVGSFRTVVEALRGRGEPRALARTEKDLPMWLVLAGPFVLILMVAVLPYLPGSFPSSLLMSLLVFIFGFFFVTVSSRFVGVAGYSIEPVTPMVFTTVMATCLIFVLLGWKGDVHQAMVVTVGAVVCIAAGNAGATSQDLKTGFLIGATPYRQQLALFIGVVLSALVVGGTILLIDHSIPNVPHAIGYVAPGQDAPKYAAPQATILAMLIKAVMSGKMPWGLVLIGVALAIVIELSGLMALSVAAGIYLPLSTTTAIFVGSLIRWLVMRKQKEQSASHSLKDMELSKGMLYATGLVAGGAIAGMLLGFFAGFFPNPAKMIDLGREYWNSKRIQPFGDYLSIAAFFVLGYLLYRKAKQK